LHVFFSFWFFHGCIGDTWFFSDTWFLSDAWFLYDTWDYDAIGIRAVFIGQALIAWQTRDQTEPFQAFQAPDHSAAAESR
jgi:hypothetical protein